MRSRLPVMVCVALVVTSAAAAPVAQALAKPRRATPARSVSPLPTCDEIAGATIKTSVSWRIFESRAVGEKRPRGDRWACRRGPGPAQQFTNLSGLRGFGVSAGDLLDGSNDGRYNPESYAIDLATGRFTVIDEYLAKNRRDLLGSGVVVPAPSNYGPADPALATDPAYAAFGADDSPSAGFYVTAADGSAVRTAPPAEPAAVTTADWTLAPTGAFAPTAPLGITSAGFQAAKHPGIVVTPLLGNGYELESRAGRGRRAATLEIHGSSLLAFGVNPRRSSDRVARLVPGSEAEAHVYGNTVAVGRFSDRPGEVRARFLSHGDGPVDRYQLDFAPPAASVSNPYAVSAYGDTAIVSGDRIMLFLPGDAGSGYSLQTQPAPGAHDIAIVRDISPGRTISLYWTDGAGQAHRATVVRPA